MQTKVIEPKKVFKRLEVVFETPEEADIFWMLISMSHNSFEKQLDDFDDCPKRVKLFAISTDMFKNFDKEYTPPWYKDC